MERQVSTADTDCELQAQELICLTSLLSTEEFQQFSATSGSLLIHPLCDTPVLSLMVKVDQLQLLFPRLTDVVENGHTDQPLEEAGNSHVLMTLGHQETDTLYLVHLPPLHVNFRFPKDYPSKMPPFFEIRCPWLNQQTLKKLEQQLSDIWRQKSGLPVLYDVFHHLRTCLTDRTLFPLGQTLLLVQESDSQLSQLREDPSGNVFYSSEATQVMESLLVFNRDRKDILFQRELQVCPVCLDSFPGKHFIRLRNCSHPCCQICFAETCRMHIVEGSVALIRCLVCDADVNPHDVALITSREIYEKYQKLQLNLALDAMEDVTYCPRPACNAPVIRDDRNSQVALCHCGYAFCCRCRGSFHGVAPCSSSLQRLQYLENKAEESSGKTSIRAKLLEMIEEAKNEVWIEKSAKNCPNCYAVVEKNGGCNHMTCYVCESEYCWLCLTVMSGNEIYDHVRRCKGSTWTSPARPPTAPAELRVPDEAEIDAAVSAFQGVPETDLNIVDILDQARLLVRAPEPVAVPE